MRALITGINGMDGSHLADLLLEKGYVVYGMERRTSSPNRTNTKHLEGNDSLLSIVQMPKGIPVGSLAIGKDGAINAALLASAIIANNNPSIKKKFSGN